MSMKKNRLLTLGSPRCVCFVQWYIRINRIVTFFLNISCFYCNNKYVFMHVISVCCDIFAHLTIIICVVVNFLQKDIYKWQNITLIDVKIMFTISTSEILAVTIGFTSCYNQSRYIYICQLRIRIYLLFSTSIIV